jgi:hypothetical protein
MKISSAQQNIAASHVEVEQREVSERLRVWIGDRPDVVSRPGAGRDEGLPSPADASAHVALSPEARALAATPSLFLPVPLAAPSSRPASSGTAGGAGEASAIAAALDQVENDPMLAILRQMLERMFGIHLDVFDAAELQTDAPATEDLQKIPASAAEAPGNAGFGIEYDYHERRTESESTRFTAAGLARTADGAEIRFALSFEMTRSYTQQIDVSLRAGDAVRKKDPLVINFGGSAAQLSDRRFAIDLDGDGRAEQARFLAQGSGFLVFDRNADGKAGAGSELFGPGTGDGFAELAAHDSDRNGWIDENDAIYGRLRVWTKLDDGSDVLRSLAEAEVGAISLARVATPFALRDGDNTPLGEVRTTAVYLGDDGRAGTVQQVDLTI